MGRGNLKADIAIVGGIHGGLQGIYADVLKPLLMQLDMMSNVYITNVIKCCPDKIKTPSSDEVVACRRYLQAEMEVVKPRIIVMLGQMAEYSITLKKTLKRGAIVDCPPKFYAEKCITTWHPCDVLFQGQFRELELQTHLAYAKEWSTL